MVMDARPYENQQSREVCGVRQTLARREVGATAYGTNCVTERAVERCNLNTEVSPPFCDGIVGGGLFAKCKAYFYHVALSDDRSFRWEPFSVQSWPLNSQLLKKSV